MYPCRRDATEATSSPDYATTDPHDEDAVVHRRHHEAAL